MKHNDSQKQKSLWALHKARRTTEKSPILTGQLNLQRHTFAAIAEEFDQGDGNELACDIAAWENTGRDGRPYLTVELSPPFRRKRKARTRMFSWLSDDDNE
jgi:hypothetical protein